MALIIADSDVLIDFLSGSGAAADVVDRELAAGRLATTVISRFELLAGIEGSGRRARATQELLDLLDTLPLNRNAADRAAVIRRGSLRRGSAIAMADCMIAGITFEQRGLLLTRNRRHFEQIEGLRLVAFE